MPPSTRHTAARHDGCTGLQGVWVGWGSAARAAQQLDVPAGELAVQAGHAHQCDTARLTGARHPAYEHTRVHAHLQVLLGALSPCFWVFPSRVTLHPQRTPICPAGVVCYISGREMDFWRAPYGHPPPAAPLHASSGGTQSAATQLNPTRQAMHCASKPLLLAPGVQRHPA